MARGLKITLAEALEHQRKHGFSVEEFVNRGQKAQKAVDKIIAAHQKMTLPEKEFGMRLEVMKRDGEIDDYIFQGIKLRLADGCWYTPDYTAFRSVSSDFDNGCRLTFYEIKGRKMWDDAKVKFKVAREQITWADFELWQRVDGRWTRLL